METFVQDTLNEHLLKLSSQKEAFIKEMFIKKGYRYLVEPLAVQRFPQITSVFHEGWTYYFADNDTVNGDFIVAIEEPKSEMKDNFRVEISFRWQDKDYTPVKYFEASDYTK